MAVTKLAIKPRPTNADLQAQVAEVHSCLNAVDGKADMMGQQMAALARAMGVELPTEEDLRNGVPPRRVKRRMGGMTPLQAIGVLSPAVATGCGMYKFFEPAIVAGALALHHALMGAH